MLKKKNNKIRLIPFALMAIAPLSLACGVSAFKLASAEDFAYRLSYSKDVTSENITNPSFADISSTYDNDEDGVVGSWTAIEEDSGANGMIIDIGSASSENSTTSFNNYQKTVYFLDNNPGKSGSDNKILMINSKTSSTTQNQQANKGFRSEEITLTPNSYYKISFAVKTDRNGDESVNASAYLTGIVDEEGNPLEIGYEFLKNSGWKNYEIFVATGDKGQTVTLDFYLGTNKNGYSTGAVFFDDVQMYQYSANEFISTAKLSQYKADNYDNLTSTNTKFMITTLLEKENTLVDESYNFDFENSINSSNSLSPAWEVANHKSAHARIMKYDYPNTDFEKESGYNYAGLDLSYDILNDKPNEQALVLWSKPNENGYITLQSKPIDINPHQIYKITASVKVVSADGAGFTLGVQEIGLSKDNTQGIYAYHQNLNSSNYTLQNGQSSGITSNTTNDFTNNYQTVEFYLKGHSLYKSSFAITLSLGSESSTSVGYVVVDNIKIENASYSDFSSASNKLTFSSYTTTNENNSYFNETEASDENYPVTATGYTVEKDNEDVNISGVLYLYDKSMYEELYNAYEWYGIYPGSPQNSNKTNNIYMMYNNKNSHQSITSSSFSLDSEYQKVSFDFYTQSKFITNSASVTVEIVDENGIMLYKNTIASEGCWSDFAVIFHSAENMSHSYTIKISLGTEDEEIAGYVYLDNLIATESNAEEYNNAYYKNDFSDYFLSFENDKVTGDANTSITTSAYKFEIEEAFDGEEDFSNYAVGAVVNGKENVYGIENDLNLLVITTFKPSTATITSLYTLSLESESYYKLTFDLQTMFFDGVEPVDDEHECNYGVSITINGFEAISNLTSDKLKTFTIYLNSSQASTATIAFSVSSDCHNTLGTAILTNIDLTSSTQAEFNNASNVQGYKETVFQSSYIQEEDDDESAGDEDTGSGDTTEPSTSPTSPWLLIGSIIMAVAMIVAIIAFFLRKIKFKKKDKIEKSKYDRKTSIDQNLVTNEAVRRRDEELKNLFEAKESLKEEKAKLEEQHKNYVQEARISDKGKITKDTEKEFKSYTTNMAKIEEKLTILEEQISVVSSPEHLISLEKEVMDEEEYRLKQEQKAIKEEIKTNNQPAPDKAEEPSNKKSAGKKSATKKSAGKKSTTKKSAGKKSTKNDKK